MSQTYQLIKTIKSLTECVELMNYEIQGVKASRDSFKIDNEKLRAETKQLKFVLIEKENEILRVKQVCEDIGFRYDLAKQKIKQEKEHSETRFNMFLDEQKRASKLNAEKNMLINIIQTHRKSKDWEKAEEIYYVYQEKLKQRRNKNKKKGS